VLRELGQQLSDNRPSELKRRVALSEQPSVFELLEWLRGPATPRKRHSLILPYRFELTRDVAA